MVLYGITTFRYLQKPMTMCVTTQESANRLLPQKYNVIQNESKVVSAKL